MIGESGDFPGGGLGNFKGLVSSELFNEVRLVDPIDQVAYDDVFFGIPAPAGLYVLAMAAFSSPRRRAICRIEQPRS